MPKPQIQFTKEGYEALQQELVNLQTKRPQVLKRMVEAREQGDLSENAGYHAAKEELSHIDSRTREVKNLLRFGSIVESSQKKSIDFGSTVTLKAGSGESLKFTIVNALEANPSKGKISDQSPIGSSLLGKEVGDSVTIGGEQQNLYQITEIN